MSKVQWEISNNEVTDRDTALRRLQEGTTGHVVCARDGACLQSYNCLLYTSPSPRDA